MLLLVIPVCVSSIWARLSPDQVSLPAELSTGAERAEIVPEASVEVAQGLGARAQAVSGLAPGPLRGASGPRPWTVRHRRGPPLVPGPVRAHRV